MAKPCLRAGMMDAMAAGPTTEISPMPMPSMKRVISIIVALVARAPPTAPAIKLIAVMIKLFLAPSFAKIPPAGKARTAPIRVNIDITQPMLDSVNPSSVVNSVVNIVGALNIPNEVSTPRKNTEQKINHLLLIGNWVSVEPVIINPLERFWLASWGA